MSVGDKTLIAEYAANEMLRINARLKEMISSETPPSEELRKEVIEDIETTLNRLQRAISHIQIDDTDNNKEEIKQ